MQKNLSVVLYDGEYSVVLNVNNARGIKKTVSVDSNCNILAMTDFHIDTVWTDVEESYRCIVNMEAEMTAANSIDIYGILDQYDLQQKQLNMIVAHKDDGKSHDERVKITANVGVLYSVASKLKVSGRF